MFGSSFKRPGGKNEGGRLPEWLNQERLRRTRPCGGRPWDAGASDLPCQRGGGSPAPMSGPSRPTEPGSGGEAEASAPPSLYYAGVMVA